MTPLQRRGLPRVPGGEPWPPAREVPARILAVDDAPVAQAVAVAVAVPVAGDLSDVPLRRGLPRSEGGEPWPTAGFAPARIGVDAAATPATMDAGPPDVVALSTVPLRRGLPRSEGGEPWPAAGFAPAWAVTAAVERTEVEAAVVEAAPIERVVEQQTPGPVATAAASSPARVTPSVRERRPLHPHARRALVWSGALLGLAAIAVLVARWLVTLEPIQDFLADYPGYYELPDGAPVGIPAWLSWQHFFNVFLLVLIVRTGLMVRRQQRPEAYWAPRANPGGRSSLMSWTHQALDVLWVANGVLYVVLLFATGQWMRIVPTSLDVFPNAVSAVLQYLSLDWPPHDSWAYYNSLQQIFYFLTVFVAAPLAVATGVRMSIYWRGGARWDRIYPKSVARALHFPVMIYFVAFVVGHVALVLTTGARENLNHMFASSDAGGWAGTVIFGLSLVVMVGAVFALRPLFIAPVAQRFGTVSSR